MMASQQTKLHDPMYNFDTHFPERLSRLHVHGDLNASGSFRRKKGRSHRTGARYKTQPVTFDEITEVDEEQPTSAAAGKKKGGSAAEVDSHAKSGGGSGSSSAEHVLGQLQAFSRSMEGLVPKSSAVFPEHLPFHISHSRSGSRKFQRHPDCIPEKSEAEPASPEGGGAEAQKPALSKAAAPLGDAAAAADGSGKSVAAPSTSGGGATGTPPIPSVNIASRRQKVTAKAKKRQKTKSESDSVAGT